MCYIAAVCVLKRFIRRVFLIEHPQHQAMERKVVIKKHLKHKKKDESESLGHLKKK